MDWLSDSWSTTRYADEHYGEPEYDLCPHGVETIHVCNKCETHVCPHGIAFAQDCDACRADREDDDACEHNQPRGGCMQCDLERYEAGFGPED